MNGKTPDGCDVNANGAWVNGTSSITKHAKHAATGVKITTSPRT